MSGASVLCVVFQMAALFKSTVQRIRGLFLLVWMVCIEKFWIFCVTCAVTQPM